MAGEAWFRGYQMSSTSSSSLCASVGNALMNIANRGALYTRPTGGYVGSQFANGRYIMGEVMVPTMDSDTFYPGGEAWVATDSPNFWFDVVHEAAHMVYDPADRNKMLTDAGAGQSSITAQQAATQCY